MKHENQHYYSSLPDTRLKIQTVAESLRGHLYIFKTASGVFSFRKLDNGTKLLIEYMTIPEQEAILLDLGCGYGPIGIVLGYEATASKVFLVDVNKRAIWCTKENIKTNISNYKGRVRAMKSNYFEKFKANNLRFDGIYMNPPIRLGRREFLDICAQVPDFLTNRGFFQFVIRKKMGADIVLKNLKTLYDAQNVDIICKRGGYWVFKCFHES
ncbi:MAG: class I SAM-dependent methyltransferase [Candidatus Lokiarchaeota archaeon]|nr:class I SAM-dependent methyltransferase [Candidatus Lokiarchaeota archaeon]